MATRTSRLEWVNQKRKLSELAPWGYCPRVIKDKQAERLLDSFTKFGQVLPICIGPNGEIYDGHQRRSVIGAAGQYGMDYEVDVRVASRELTERERQQLTVYLHKGAAGEFDFDSLFDWNLDELVEWGFDDIGAIAEAAQLTEIGEEGGGAGGSNTRDMGDKRKQIKPVLYADEIDDFEQAILATGVRNRGEALLTICRFYLEQNDNGQEKGQFDFSFESIAAAQPVKAR